MSTQTPERNAPDRDESPWVHWDAMTAGSLTDGRSHSEAYRIQNFRILATIATVILMMFVIRGVVSGNFNQIADLANAAVFAALLLVHRRRPAWHRACCWVGLLAIGLNIMDGVAGSSAQPETIQPFHLIIPIVVLYGASLGEISISIVAALGAIGIYSFEIYSHWPLHTRDFNMLTNLITATLGACLVSIAVWYRHQRIVETLHVRTIDLQRELDARLRLNAVIFHDIGNPLTVLAGITHLAREDGRMEGRDLDEVDQMIRRIEAIIKSTREMGATLHLTLTDTTVESLWQQILPIFERRLAEKDLRLTLAAGGHLTVHTNPDILCNSVLSNLVNNAIKFSPRGGTIEIAASPDDLDIRIEVRDQGTGIPPDILARGPAGQDFRTRPGTEGEIGSAFGLRIVALCLYRLGGRLELRNRRTGGATVAAVIPRGKTAPA